MKIEEYEFCYPGDTEPVRESVGNVQRFQMGGRDNAMNRVAWILMNADCAGDHSIHDLESIDLLGLDQRRGTIEIIGMVNARHLLSRDHFLLAVQGYCLRGAAAFEQQRRRNNGESRYVPH
jgi:hypothetical protein